MKNKIFKIAFILSILSFVVACDKDEDYTGGSTLDIGETPTLTIDFENSTISTIESEGEEYPFTLTLAEAKPYDVHVSIEHTSGDATFGEDYDIDSNIIIPKFTTSASGSLKIISDDLIENTETATITIGREVANVNLTPLVIDLTIVNATSNDLVSSLSWSSSELVTDNSGVEIDPYDLADLRLLLTNVPYTQVFDSADGASAETYTLSGNAPDGEYYLVADFYGAMDIARDLDLTLSFNQSGIINDQTYTFSGALSTEYICASNYFVMTKVIKTGSTYVMEEVGTGNPVPSITGTYDVVSNGISTDSGPTNNPLINFMSSVEITDNGDGTYTLSDAWAGVYIDWYTIYGNTAPEPQVLTVSPCFEISTPTWNDIFGAPQTLKGTVNADGTLSIRLDNAWGDYVDAIYTPQ